MIIIYDDGHDLKFTLSVYTIRFQLWMLKYARGLKHHFIVSIKGPFIGSILIVTIRGPLVCRRRSCVPTGKQNPVSG